MKAEPHVDHYGAQYSNFASDLYARIRRAVFGEDIGQNGWITADEQDLFIAWLGLDGSGALLDVACGSGGPAMRIAARTECNVDGVDLHDAAVATANATAASSPVADRVKFRQADANEPLPWDDGTFDGIICVDAINHLEDRAAVLRDWARLLKPGGRLVFTDPIVVTGLLTNREIAVRSSIGFFLFATREADERLLHDAGFEVREAEDRTQNMAAIAHRWREMRAQHEADLRRIEGDATYDGQQEFFRVASRIAEERRLSRFAFFAVKPSAA